MHLLATKPGEIRDGSAAVDLAQTPGDIVVLSAADTEIACLAAAQRARVETAAAVPSLRLANLMRLGHNLSVDLYVEQTVRHARLVVVRVLGGRGYWPYGVDQIAATCRTANIPVAFLPGDDQPDAELDGFTTLSRDAAHRLWQFLVHGGVDNAASFLAYAATLNGRKGDWREPAPLLRAGLHWPGVAQLDLDALEAEWRARGLDTAPLAAIVFYRALKQAGNLAAVDALVAALMEAGLRPLPIFVASLRDGPAAATIRELLAAAPPDIILNTTGFAVARPGAPGSVSPLDGSDCPVLQVVFSGGSEEQWHSTTNGLSPRDIAMNVALPEVDGRVLARAVSFKGVTRRDALTEADIVAYDPVPDRIEFTARLAANWCLLRATPAAQRRVALVLANYPNRDGRMGNGVGLDTPAATVTVLRALEAAGYAVTDVPADGDALVRRLGAGPTNATVAGRAVRETLPRARYDAFVAALPDAVQAQVRARWGEPDSDPLYMKDKEAFAIPAFRCGHVIIGLQPARGYNIDPAASYHDPALTPPHGYFAFYAWLRHAFAAHAIVHMGKHGNLEWLPGKACALSEECFPEAALGPMPHLYPFIVNDPGEGSQAKRRAQAVIVDHLTPPLTRAESYGPLKYLELLVDEYYDGGDPRPAAPTRVAPRHPGARAVHPPRPRAGHRPHRRPGRGAGQARRLSVRAEGDADPRRSARLRGVAGGRPADRSAGGAGAPAARHGTQRRLPHSCPGRRSGARPRSPGLRLGCALERPTAGAADERRRVPQHRRYCGTPGAAGARPCCRRCPTGPGLDGHRRRSRRGGDAPAPRRGGVRRRGDGGTPRRARRALRRSRIQRRADPRPARSAAHRAQLLLHRHAHRAHAGGLATRLEIGRAAGRALRPGPWRLAAGDGAHRLGHQQHAHRRRRRGAGPGTHRLPPHMGRGLAPGDGVRGAAGVGPRPAAGGRDLARLRLLPAMRFPISSTCSIRRCVRWLHWRTRARTTTPSPSASPPTRRH